YTIDPSGDGGFEVYCDMTTDGGGWTLIHKSIQGASSLDRTDLGYNVVGLQSPTLNVAAVLSREVINLLGGSSNGIFRVVRNDGKKVFWRRGSAVGDMYYATDNHDVVGSELDAIEVKINDWSNSWSSGDFHHSASHAPCMGWGGGANEHACIQRWCCGAPNGGMWWNFGDFLPGDEYSSSGWVR
ncbi:MAG: hypothetical protein KJ592_00790, partial [Nanoarchaeota archaeon]|nr:hypothetical protein [Nanoarchaeota archaeon]